MRRRRLITRAGLFLVVCLLLLCNLDLRFGHPGRTPDLRENFRAEGEFQVGAARVPLRPHFPCVVAGYPPRRFDTEQARTPLYARSVVIQSSGKSLALVSVDVLEVPGALVDRVRERLQALGVDDVLVGATHTHTSLGQFDPNLVAQIGATGRYREDIARDFEETIVASVSEALRSRAPAHLRIGGEELYDVSENRAMDYGILDPRLRIAAFVDDEGRPLASIVVFGSHPTTIDRDVKMLDGDYPARAMAALERRGGVALFFQGAVGDVRSNPTPQEGEPLEWDRMAKRIAEGAERAWENAVASPETLRYAAAVIELPPAEADGVLPFGLRRAGANVLDWLLTHRARVSVLQLGAVTMLWTPAEVTTRAAEEIRLRTRVPADAWVLSVTDGYVGYLEIPQRFATMKGEAPRALYGADLLSAVSKGLARCLEAVSAGENIL